MNSDKLDTVLAGLENCSGSGQNCNCPYAELEAGSCVSALCKDAYDIIMEMLDNMNVYTHRV